MLLRLAVPARALAARAQRLAPRTDPKAVGKLRPAGKNRAANAPRLRPRDEDEVEDRASGARAGAGAGKTRRGGRSATARRPPPLSDALPGSLPPQANAARRRQARDGAALEQPGVRPSRRVVGLAKSLRPPRPDVHGAPPREGRRWFKSPEEVAAQRAARRAQSAEEAAPERARVRELAKQASVAQETEATRARRLAKRGDASAQLYLGTLHLLGKDGAEQDEKLARKWIARAAAQGDLEAVYLDAALTYDQAEASADDRARALEGLRRAAAGGHSHAQHRLAVLHFYGTDPRVPKDLARARELLDKSAAGGCTRGLSLLAAMLFKGLGGAPNLPRAAELLRRSAEEGDSAGQSALGVSLMHEGKFEEARVWLEEAAEQEDATAMRVLADLLDEGKGGDRDPQHAKLLRDRAAAIERATGNGAAPAPAPGSAPS
jgi:hypothetical protein